MKMASFSNARYYLLFVDGFSREMWVHFLKLKSNVFHEFKKFEDFVEN
jgi:hypothetical protein